MAEDVSFPRARGKVDLAERLGVTKSLLPPRAGEGRDGGARRRRAAGVSASGARCLHPAARLEGDARTQPVGEGGFFQ